MAERAGCKIDPLNHILRSWASSWVGSEKLQTGSEFRRSLASSPRPSVCRFEYLISKGGLGGAQLTKDRTDLLSLMVKEALAGSPIC